MTAKDMRMGQNERSQDRDADDWRIIIQSDECGFSVSTVYETTWVTRRSEEEYHENCIVLCFSHLTMIMVWYNGGSM